MAATTADRDRQREQHQVNPGTPRELDDVVGAHFDGAGDECLTDGEVVASRQAIAAVPTRMPSTGISG